MAAALQPGAEVAELKARRARAIRRGRRCAEKGRVRKRLSGDADFVRSVCYLSELRLSMLLRVGWRTARENSRWQTRLLARLIRACVWRRNFAAVLRRFFPEGFARLRGAAKRIVALSSRIVRALELAARE